MAEDARGGDEGGDDRQVSGDRGDDDRQAPDGRSGAGAAVDEAEGDLDLPGVVFDAIADPGGGRGHLPRLLGLLDGDDPRERLTAATAACLVAESDPETLPYVVRRLVDRLDEDAPVEVAHALDYLAARHPRDVDETVAELDEEAERRTRRQMYRTGAGFARNEYLARTEGSRPVGRTQVASGTSDDPRRTYTDDEAPDPRDLLDAAESDAGDESDDGSGGDTDAEGPPGAAAVDGADGSGRGVTSGTLQLVARRLSAVVERSRFEDLTVLSERRRGRHGDVYRAAGTLDGDEYAVALTVYRLPEGGREAFVGGFRAAVSDWAAVDDHDSVLSVYDWGGRPRPWTALNYPDETLADREEIQDPLWTALELVDAVGHAHQHGTVHGAVDPGNVAYRDVALTDAERRRPLLANLSLAAATGTATPGRGVDPRYAAPEHYDERFGAVDHATDVYGLGAVLYRLCTGRHPYDGDPDAVPENVLGSEPLSPAAVADVPERLDRVVRKATATRKLKRYETVNNLAQELRAIRDGT